MSGLYDFIDKGDVNVADRGFLVEADMSAKGASVLTAIKRGSKDESFTADQILASYRQSNRRIHVERANRGLKKCRWLQGTMDSKQKDLFTPIFRISFWLNNLERPYLNLDDADRVGPPVPPV